MKSGRFSDARSSRIQLEALELAAPISKETLRPMWR